MRGLVHLLNRYPHWKKLQGPVSSEQLSNLLRYLEPWVTAEPEVAMPSDARPPVDKLECAALPYRSTFNGKSLGKPRPIVDIVPFSNDLALLEARLLEGDGIVDLFVISEAEITIKGGLKPLYFDKVKNEPRFARFRDRILHLIRRDAPIYHTFPSSWARENRMRGLPADCLGFLVDHVVLESCPEHSPKNRSRRLTELGECGIEPDLKGPRRVVSSWGLPEKALCAIRAGLSDAWVIQNDEDELVTRKALLHMKNCELRQNNHPIHAPALMHKGNTYWMQPAKLPHAKVMPGQPPRI